MSAKGLVRFVGVRAFLNLKAAYEHRVSFWSQILFMVANNTFLIWFWHLFFQKFHNVGGWVAQDVYLLNGISALAFGLANTFAGNAMDLSALIGDGELDYYIGLPAPTLLHALITKVRVSALGDILFGVSLLWILHSHSPAQFALSLLVTIPAAIVFVSVIVLSSSLGFFIGESRGLTFQLTNLLVTFATYPESIFEGSVRWMLYIVIPAGFFSFLPAQVVRTGTDSSLHLLFEMAKTAGGAALFLALSIFIFQLGMKRYASGSSLSVRLG